MSMGELLRQLSDEELEQYLRIVDAQLDRTRPRVFEETDKALRRRIEDEIQRREWVEGCRLDAVHDWETAGW